MSFCIKVSHGNKFPMIHTTIKEVRTVDAVRRWVDRLGGNPQDAQMLIETGRAEFAGEILVMEKEVAK
jgi:hypothetical protein